MLPGHGFVETPQNTENGIEMAASAEPMSSINYSSFKGNQSDSVLCSRVFQGFEDAMNVTLVIILMLCVLGNSAICFIVSRHYQLHTVTNAYLVNLAVVQNLFTVFTIPPYLRLSNSPVNERWPCVFIGFSFVLFGALSCFALVLVTFERYHVIKEASKSKVSVKKTKRIIFIACALALVFAVLWASTDNDSLMCSTITPATQLQTANYHSVYLKCFPLLSVPKTTTTRVINSLFIVFGLLLPMSIIVVLFLKISKPLCRGVKVIRPVGVANYRSIRFFVEIKTTRTMVLISLLYQCSWLPICVIGLHKSLTQAENQALNFKMEVVCICLAFSSTFVNPLVYALRNPRFTIIFTRNRQRERKTVKFSQSRDNQQDSRRSNVWAQKPKSTCLFEQSRSDETQTSSLSPGQAMTTANFTKQDPKKWKSFIE